MPAKPLKTLDVRSRREWRAWLEKHHRSKSEIWLVFHKRHTGVKSVGYDQAVEEALCFGWIDSLIRRIDDDRYARKFTPRKPDSLWSASNRRRWAELEARGQLAPAGLERGPTDLSAGPPRPRTVKLPAYIEQALRANPPAWEEFEKLSPSQRRLYVGWIDSAKREETKGRRLREAVSLLAAGRKLGLK
ncbi:MAG TPA: YdeI/OmpD-associated family protein [Thermoanaerobaculia bacterium]|nr:YdeI/OmpD-associated family protein [Thermoanaerobaculia bacterium]